MPLLPKKLVRLYNGKRILVSNHVNYPVEMSASMEKSALGVGHFIPSPVFGTGFYMHMTESSSYTKYCFQQQQRVRHSYWRLLLGKEFSVKKEVARIESVTIDQQDNLRNRILESYRNSLLVADQLDNASRIVVELRRIVHKYHNRGYSSLLKHYKHEVSSIEHRLKNVQFKLSDNYDAKQIELYNTLCDVFIELTKCRRIWDINAPGSEGEAHAKVFFDMSMFDFITSSKGIPMLRTGRGKAYFLLPDCFIKADSSVDFETIPLSTLSILSHLVGDGVQSEIHIPELSLSFRFSSIRRADAFVQSFKQLQQGLTQPVA